MLYSNISPIYVNPDCYGIVVDFFPKTTSKVVQCYVYILCLRNKEEGEFLQEISLG